VSGPQLRHAGDSALLLQLEAVIDPDVNARAIAIAAAIRRRHLRGVRDVVPTFRSVAVYVDPLEADFDQVAAELRAASAVTAADVTGRNHEIPVVYGGDNGPDLGEVAARAGLTATQVIDRHAGAAYRVFMLGFQPGFAYMGLIDPSIASPRRASPRLRVPAGSVGIAGRQTGVYPAAAPGGWQIIGRALEPVFDEAKTPPARFAPGDTVVFVPVTSDGRDRLAPVSAFEPDPADVCLTVLRPGLYTTIQDSGAWGQQGIGVPVSGAMDTVSHAIANAAVGNPADTPALEVTVAGPELRIERPVELAVAGADLSASLDGNPIPLQDPVACQPGSVLRFGARLAGARAYVAVGGGLDKQRRHPARPIAAGQTIGMAAVRARESRPITARLPLPVGGARLRVLPGPQCDDVPGRCLDTLCARRFTVSSQSNRVGYRLSGPVAPAGPGDMISDATFPGAIQIPPSGEPILLMADRQTTGGYPQIAIVISADLPIAGQLAPGDWIEFQLCSREEARRALIEREGLRSDS
jgi:KipI family sensor histidine kinase inhibitor